MGGPLGSLTAHTEPPSGHCRRHTTLHCLCHCQCTDCDTAEMEVIPRRGRRGPGRTAEASRWIGRASSYEVRLDIAEDGTERQSGRVGVVRERRWQWQVRVTAVLQVSVVVCSARCTAVAHVWLWVGLLFESWRAGSPRCERSRVLAIRWTTQGGIVKVTA